MISKNMTNCRGYAGESCRFPISGHERLLKKDCVEPRRAGGRSYEWDNSKTDTVIGSDDVSWSERSGELG